MNEWTIYGLYADGGIAYIGITKHPTKRDARHRIDLMAGRPFEMRVLDRASSLAEAKRMEVAMIQRHRPPMNDRHHPKRNRRVVQKVQTQRTNSLGGIISFEMRLREGTMHPDQAREIWYGGDGGAPERIAMMPGWRLNQAYYVFGSPYKLNRAMEEATRDGWYWDDQVKAFKQVSK